MATALSLSRVVVCLAVLIPAASVEAQRDVKDQHLNAIDGFVQKSYEAVQLYRSGNLIGALERLGTLKRDEQLKAVTEIRAQVHARAAGRPPKKEEVVQWTPRLLRALGALHMEAALFVSGTLERDKRAITDHHLDLAARIFDTVATVTKERDSFSSRWILVIGLKRLADGEFADAYRILSPHCDDTQSYAPLLVACGSLHETFASFNAGQLRGLAAVRNKARASTSYPMTIGHGIRELADARSERNHQLATARKYFERALALDASSTEAMLRLGHVRMMQQEDRPAAELFERLAALPSLEPGDRYLVLLFLSRIHERQNQLDAADALLAKATMHQSALLARAHIAQRRGDEKAAAALVDRAARLGTDDPWWGYRFGQYWLPEALLQSLREEVRK